MVGKKADFPHKQYEKKGIESLCCGIVKAHNIYRLHVDIIYENEKAELEEILQQASEDTPRNVILAALAKVGASRIDQSNTSEERDG